MLKVPSGPAQTTWDRRSRSWVSVALILLSVLCAVPGASYLAVWLALEVTSGFPPVNPSLNTLKWVVWADYRGWVSLRYTVGSVVFLVTAGRVGRVRFYVWVVPLVAILGTFTFWAGLYFRD
jgi:hypothetical protein